MCSTSNNMCYLLQLCKFRRCCCICFDKFWHTKIISLKCGKTHDICLQCFDNYVKAEVGNNQDVRCPQCSVDGLTITFNSDQLKRWGAPSTSIERIESMEVRKSTDSLQNCQNCGRPYFGHDKLPNPECPYCYKNIIRIPEDDINEYMAQSGAFTCICGFIIERMSGCNLITCKCGKKYCWYCSKNIRDYTHFDHGVCASYADGKWKPRVVV